MPEGLREDSGRVAAEQKKRKKYIKKKNSRGWKEVKEKRNHRDGGVGDQKIDILMREGGKKESVWDVV